MQLKWHSYKYFPYEQKLAEREVCALLLPEVLSRTPLGLDVEGITNAHAIERLVYFDSVAYEDKHITTLQARLERSNGSTNKRQATRYSAHGLHEYKGRFNPQIVRAILNILHVYEGNRVLDPFCGSGTTLVECAHVGIDAVGLDMNPLAVFIANAKQIALQTPILHLREQLASILDEYSRFEITSYGSDGRSKYLQSWFRDDIHEQIERLRISILRCASDTSAVFLVIASNLLRDYSQQDPKDLRIRRRKSDLPKAPLISVFKDAVNLALDRLAQAQFAMDRKPKPGEAFLVDSRDIQSGAAISLNATFDCVITSPPYATALPYIDTQRLSLVWLELVLPNELLELESHLVGSRELRGKGKKNLVEMLLRNGTDLPIHQVEYCRLLQASLTENDGFRRQAMPLLLYRYFKDMGSTFKSIREYVEPGTPFALVVGHNHTVLGGTRFDIDTPCHLTQIAESAGWNHQESIPLETYQRYGYHMRNAVNSESLVILRAK